MMALALGITLTLAIAISITRPSLSVMFPSLGVSK